ncbi:MAG: DUF2312 domain-containing protein [Sphingobium sp.]
MSEVIAADKLRLHIEAVERLESEEQGLKEDKKERYALMKAEGFNVKVARKLIAMRKRDPNDRTTEETELALYAEALGMQLGFEI